VTGKPPEAAVNRLYLQESPQKLQSIDFIYMLSLGAWQAVESVELSFAASYLIEISLTINPVL
jgi:hypothetical protein